jgi:hypothetical protein
MVSGSRRFAESEEIYLLFADETLGPFAREQAARLLSDGTIDRNSLAKIGLHGRVFPARVLTQHLGE